MRLIRCLALLALGLMIVAAAPEARAIDAVSVRSDAPAIDLTAVVEAPQTAERMVELLHPAPAPEVLMGYHVPRAGHPDASAIELLAAVLSGAGGPDQRSPRVRSRGRVLGRSRGGA